MWAKVAHLISKDPNKGPELVHSLQIWQRIIRQTALNPNINIKVKKYFSSILLHACFALKSRELPHVQTTRELIHTTFALFLRNQAADKQVIDFANVSDKDEKAKETENTPAQAEEEHDAEVVDSNCIWIMLHYA
jgi:hypothetical protein